MRERDHGPGQLLACNLSHAPLVRRAHEREEQHDGEGFDALLSHAPAGTAHRLLVERDDDPAFVVEALGHAVAPAAGTDRRRRGERGVPDVLLEAAPDLDLVAVALARDEPRHGAGHLDHRVVGGRGPVHDHLGRGEQIGERELHAVGEPPDAADHALGLIARRRRMLLERDAAVVDEDEVGERAADVDADAEGRAWHAGWLHRRTRRRQVARRVRQSMGSRLSDVRPWYASIAESTWR